MNEITYHSRVLSALDTLGPEERGEVAMALEALKNGETVESRAWQLVTERNDGQVYVYRVGPSLRLVVRRSANEPNRYEVTDIVRHEAIVESYAVH